MITIDSLLIDLHHQGIELLDNRVPNRDKKILVSLARQITAGYFLTENQAKLLLKILKENKEFLPTDTSALDFPIWSQSFRLIEQVRNIFLKKENDGQILIEFTYNKRLRQQISDLNKVIEGQMISLTGKQYSVPLTEKNVFTVVNTFKDQKFNIDENLMKFYGEICEILKANINPFEIFKIKNDKLISLIESDAGPVSENNLTLLNDRRHMYQYTIFQKNAEKSLKNSLANRPGTKVWIDSTVVSLADVITALKDLNRLPLLLVFNGHEAKDCIKNIENLSLSLKNTDPTDSIGIYFRFDSSSDTHKNFNTKISQLGYNNKLSDNTTIAGIANNKLPKFMILNKWRPKSVISFSNNFKNNKTSLYCDNVDLIIYYNDKRPLGDTDAIV
jgi:GR25 family glycosyltransferase involved in LPS biosynthesis